MGSASVIIPSFEGGERLTRLLESLAAQSADHEALVVDNGSAAGVVARVGERYPGVEVIRMERNVGFSRAVNIAAERAAGDVLVLVNDDCVCDPGFVGAIAGALAPADGVVMAAGVLRDGRDQSLIDTAGMELDRSLLVFDYMNGEPLSRLDAEVPDPIGPCGAAAAFDRATFVEAGGFDEHLFAYWEDVDLVLRLVREGGRCVLAPGARGTHEHSATLGSGSARKNYLTGFGRGYVLRKWGVLRDPRRLAATLARDGVVCLGQAVVDRNVAGVRGRLRGYAASRRSEPFPDRAVHTHAPSAATTLRRRAVRRARLRWPRKTGARAGAGLRVLAVFHLSGLSGPARSLEPPLRWLAESGELDAVVPGPGQLETELAPIARVTRLPYEALTRPAGPLGAARAAAQLVGEVRMFRSCLRRSRPDLVLVVTSMLPAALLAARLERLPAIVYVGELPRRGHVGGIGRRLGGAAVTGAVGRLASGIVVCSDAVARSFDRVSGIPVETIRPPIDPARLEGDRDRSRARLGIDGSAPCVAAVGAITEGRGQDVLIRALPELRRSFPLLRCVIAGEPFPRSQDLAYRRSLDALVRELALDDAVIFPGFQDRVGDVYAAADVVVNPARFDEPFGRVAFEALLAGRPVVSARVGAVPESLVDGETALLVPPDEPAELAAAVGRLLGDRELAGRLVARGGAFAREQLDPARAREQWSRVVEAVLERRPSDP